MEKTIETPDLKIDVNVKVHADSIHIDMVAKGKCHPGLRYYKSTDIYRMNKFEEFLFGGNMEKMAKKQIVKFVNKCAKKYPKDLIKEEKEIEAYTDNFATAKKVLDDEVLH